MPRKAKPPAIPIEIPRTEKDLEVLMTAIETHMAEGSNIGRKIIDGRISPSDALDEAAQADERLYQVLDTIQAQRFDERDKEISEETE